MSPKNTSPPPMVTWHVAPLEKLVIWAFWVTGPLVPRPVARLGTLATRHLGPLRSFVTWAVGALALCSLGPLLPWVATAWAWPIQGMDGQQAILGYVCISMVLHGNVVGCKNEIYFHMYMYIIIFSCRSLGGMQFRRVPRNLKVACNLNAPPLNFPKLISKQFCKCNTSHPCDSSCRATLCN